MITLYSHNKESYEKAKALLEEHNKVLIQQATGTGKSFITMKLIQEDYANCKKLYVIPRVALKENLLLYPEWCEDNTDFITYSKLSKADIKDIIDDYDVFIFDEVHHAAAYTWNKSVVEVLNSGKTCIGLTATPIRMDGVDVSKLLFKDTVVLGPSVTEAIQSNIWSNFIYILTVSTLSERLLMAKNKVEDLPATVDTLSIKTESLGYTLDEASNYSVRNIVQKYTGRNSKWLVFCSSIKELDNIDDDIRDWFEYKDVTIIKVDGRLSKKKTREKILQFSNATHDTVVLVSVGILIEGMHIGGVTGAILLRHTNSLSMYLQMIGRVMTTNKEVTPVIIDVADNLTMLRRTLSSTLQKPNRSNNKPTKFTSTVMLSKEISIQTDMLISMEEFIEKVNKINVDSIWTDNELQILRRFYPDVKGRLNKSQISIKKKAIELGLVKVTKWSIEEDEVLKAHYPTDGMRVSEILTNKSNIEISNRVRKLGLRYKKRWSFEEDEEVLRGKIPNGRTEEECRERLVKIRRDLL